MLDDGAFEDEKTLLQLSHRVIADVLAGRSPTPNDTEHIVRSSTSSLRAPPYRPPSPFSPSLKEGGLMVGSGTP
jgi:hypothetical protein